MCIYFNRLSSLPDSPLHNHWCSGGGGHCGKGAIHSLSETDGCCRQRCRSPSPRDARRRRGSGWAPGGEFGSTTAKSPPLPSQTCSRTRTQGTPKLHPRAFHTGLPSIISFLHISSLSAPTPLRRPLLRREKGRGSHTSPVPGTPGPGLACEGGREGEAGTARGLGLGGTGGSWGAWDGARGAPAAGGVAGFPRGGASQAAGGLTMGTAAEGQQEQEDGQEGCGRGHRGAVGVAVPGAAQGQVRLRVPRWASGCGRGRGRGRAARGKPGLHRAALRSPPPPPSCRRRRARRPFRTAAPPAAPAPRPRLRAHGAGAGQSR